MAVALNGAIGDAVRGDHRETADAYAGELFRLGRYRVAICREGIQWLFQRQRPGFPDGGAAWDTLGYCTTRTGLMRLHRAHIGPDAAAIARWPEANIGIVCGPTSGLFVVEADTLSAHGTDGVGNLTQLIEKNGGLPHTIEAESPSGSWHIYFKWPEGEKITNSTGTVAPGVDVRGAGGMGRPAGVPGRRTRHRRGPEPAATPVREPDLIELNYRDSPGGAEYGRAVSTQPKATIFLRMRTW